jgi:hypothetical protein
MRRVLCTCGVIAGVIAGLVLAAGCTGETNQSTAISTSDPLAEATGFARSANATIAALQTAQGAATATSLPTKLPLTGTPESYVGSNQQADQTSAQGEDSSVSVDTDPSPIPAAAPNAAGVAYLDFEGAKTTFFSVDSSNTVPPEDILHEINWFGGAGGGGWEEGPCEEPSIDAEGSDPYEPLDVIVIGSCGWQPGEIVTVKLTKPDGVVVSETRDGLWYELALDDPLGEYEVVFQGESVELRATAIVALPEEPRLYIRDGELILYNFEPGEGIRLLAYDATFKAWSSFQTDQRGELIVELNSASMPDTYTFVVVGEKSGEIFPYPSYRISAGTSVYTVLPTVAIEHGGPLLEISGISILRPAALFLESTPSLWSIAPYEDLLSPGTNIYDVHLSSWSDEMLWRFSWCALDEVTLQEILDPMTLRFLVNGTGIPMYMFVQDDASGSGGLSCRWWTTSIRHWPGDAVSELAIEYDLATAINDGATSYPAGAYRHVIRVSADQ